MTPWRPIGVVRKWWAFVEFNVTMDSYAVTFKSNDNVTWATPPDMTKTSPGRKRTIRFASFKISIFSGLNGGAKIASRLSRCNRRETSPASNVARSLWPRILFPIFDQNT